MSRVGEQLTWICTCQTQYISGLPPCQHELVQAHMHTPQLQSLVHKAYAYMLRCNAGWRSGFLQACSLQRAAPAMAAVT